MGLTMREKKALTNEIATRYRSESRKGKQTILDEFCRSTGYHRKYAMQLLNSWGKKKITIVEGEAVEFVVGEPRKPRKRNRSSRSRKLSRLSSVRSVRPPWIDYWGQNDGNWKSKAAVIRNTDRCSNIKYR